MKDHNHKIDFSPFDKKYATNEKCLDRIYEIRWKNGFKCPRCNCSEYWEVMHYKYKCRNCGYQSTVTAGTFFHKTHLPMLKWFKAIYYVGVRREKSNAVELKDILELGSNRTALSVLNKIKPMVYCRSKKKLSWYDNPLKGIVEVYKTVVYGDNEYEYHHIYIAVENNNGTIGRVRIVEYPEYKSEKAFYRSFVSQLIDNKAAIRYCSPQISCPLAVTVARDFKEWCKGKEKTEFSSLFLAYCKMINVYKTDVTFDEILNNILRGDTPPVRNSTLL